MGFTCKKLTLPTGKEDGLAKVIPKREPAQAIWYSGAFSQKYFNEFMTSGQSWISSKIIRVLWGSIFCPLTSIKFLNMRLTSLVVSKNCL